MNTPRDTEQHPSQGVLRKLQQRLAGMLFKLRSGSRNSFTAGASRSRLNSLLSDKITHLNKEYARQQTAAVIEPGSKQKPQVKKQAGGMSGPANLNPAHFTRQDTGETEFSKHIKKTYRTSASYAGIVDKLSASLWEHIHTSLRLARLGNDDRAGIHQQIAMNALEEIGHYLAETEYQKLVSEIEDYIQQSNS